MEQEDKSRAAALLGSLGGKARARALSTPDRRKIAQLGGLQKAENARRKEEAKARRRAARKGAQK